MKISRTSGETPQNAPRTAAQDPAYSGPGPQAPPQAETRAGI